MDLYGAIRELEQVIERKDLRIAELEAQVHKRPVPIGTARS
jgi:hypothetical protein